MTNHFQDQITTAWQYLFEGQLDALEDILNSITPKNEIEQYDYSMLLGYLNFEKLNYPKALAEFQNLETIAQRIDSKEKLGIAFHQQAMVLRELKEYQKGLSLIQKEREIIDLDFPDDREKLAVNGYEQGYLRLLLGKLDESQIWLNDTLNWSK
ncbi:MAG: hypothetical protein LBM27_01120 [Lactobacillaceae bacterium]|jgi:tetratricopeptide (TPR) repeat protein|nr:hypothetical protein [Lactobacillaceae bacterium]